MQTCVRQILLFLTSTRLYIIKENIFELYSISRCIFKKNNNCRLTKAYSLTRLSQYWISNKDKLIFKLIVRYFFNKSVCINRNMLIKIDCSIFNIIAQVRKIIYNIPVITLIDFFLQNSHIYILLNPSTS